MVEISNRDFKNILKFLDLFQDMIQDILNDNKVNWAKKKAMQKVHKSIEDFKFKLNEKKNV